jgi:hypothetical protein
MLKFLQLLRSPDHQGIKSLDDEIQSVLGTAPAKTLQQVADHLLAKGKELADQRLLTFELLDISLHKIKRSNEWNCLLIRYKDAPYHYQSEIILVPEQTTLAL